MLKQLLIFGAISISVAFTLEKPTDLQWIFLSETSWEQKSDETNSTNLWVPTFSKRLKLLDKTEVSIVGYISMDATGQHILTQFKRNPKSTKDRSAEPPDFILLDGFDENTYYAEVKKYTLTGELHLNAHFPEVGAVSLLYAQLVP